MASSACTGTLPAVICGSAASRQSRRQSRRTAASAHSSRADVCGLGSALPARGALSAARANRAASRRSSAVVLASVTEPTAGSVSSASFVQVLRLEDLPKGTRKVVGVAGRQVMLFYYRDQLYAIEARSPAEGAYSEGFTNARFTQDGCIICPSTKSTFDIKTGEIREWYPDNFVLRSLTPKETCRPMEVYPVKVEDGIVSIDVANTNLGSLSSEELEKYTGSVTRGGANTSAENNNVFGIEPRMYLETGEEVSDSDGGKKPKIAPATIIIGTVAVAIIAVAGTAFALSKESIPGVIAVWVGLFVPVAYAVVKFGGEGEDPPQ